MADDKKPKIDLKSRLQKMGGPGAATPPPPIAGPGMATPGPPMARAPGPPPSVPPRSASPRPMISSPAPALDPNNPLAAVAQPFKPAGPSRPAAAIAQAQRIEVDEGAVQPARSGARRQRLIVGLLFAVVLGGLGWVGGTASQQGTDRGKRVKDAHDLAGDIG